MVSSQFDAATMHSQPQLAAATQMPDDGSGRKEIYRIEQFKMVPSPESMHGIFFAGDSFVIQYTYSDQQRSYTLIYFWLGHHSSQDEQGAAALGAIELDRKINGVGTIIRVVQDKEPLHFMAMFHGHMIIFKVNYLHVGFEISSLVLYSMESEVVFEIYNITMRIPVKMKILIYFKFVAYRNMIPKLYK